MQTLKIFYQLPQISSHPPGIKWITSPKLQKYIENRNNPHVNQIAYHLVTTPPTTITTTCLTALLAHITLHNPQRLKSTHTLLQQHYTEDLNDLYQIGLELISQPHSFLSNFDPTKSLAGGYWYPSFYKWSQQKFDRLLIDKIRNQKGMSSFKRSNLSLASRATPTKISKALTQQGYPPASHPTYLTLHHCLKTAVQAKSFNTSNPQTTDYTEILTLYRQTTTNPLNLEQITNHLDQLGKAIRNYEQLSLQSIEIPINTENNQTLSDITIAHQPTPIDNAILDEYQQQVTQLKKTVIQLLQQLPIKQDLILLLIYGLEITQSDIGKELNCHQATIPKNRNKILARIAQATYQPTRDKSPPLTSEQLQPIITHLIALCQEYYPDLRNQLIHQHRNRDFDSLLTAIQTRWQINFLPHGSALTALQKFYNS
jgi:RNA polymerase sigma factor (sigma-70 family)